MLKHVNSGWGRAGRRGELPRQPLTSSTLKWKELLLVVLPFQRAQTCKAQVGFQRMSHDCTSRGARMGGDHAEVCGQQQGRVRPWNPEIRRARPWKATKKSWALDLNSVPMPSRRVNLGECLHLSFQLCKVGIGIMAPEPAAVRITWVYLCEGPSGWLAMSRHSDWGWEWQEAGGI